METKQVTIARIYLLVMNSVYSNAEYGTIVAVAFSYDKLYNFYLEQLEKEPYRDDYYRNFKKDGPLYNYNPLPSLALNELDSFNHGIRDQWIDVEEIDRVRSNYYVIE